MHGCLSTILVLLFPCEDVEDEHLRLPEERVDAEHAVAHLARIHQQGGPSGLLLALHHPISISTYRLELWFHQEM
jgi:hypothetical protein